VIKPTKSQNGGFLGTLLASIGVPLLLNALTGKGLQVDKKRPKRSVPVYVTSNTTLSSNKKDRGLVLPLDYRSPPFFGSWKNPVGMGIKKKQKKVHQKKGQGLILGKNSPFNGIPLIGAIL